MIDRAFARVPVVRAKLAILVTLLITGWLTYRLSDVQIRQSSNLSRLALSQHSETVDAFAKRGQIVDRDGTVLVRSLPSESVYAVPTSIDAANVPDIAAKLSPILGYPPDRLEAALRERTPFRYLKRKIPHSVAERVGALGIDGIGLKPEDTGVRYAPSGRLASTVLGFVGTEEDGLAGLEYSFDSYLRGVPGKTRIEADEFGRAIPFGDSEVIERAVPGRTLVLTLDSYVQFEAEHQIEAAMKTWHARSATAMVMDVHTGEILAMANAPDFDPNHFATANENAWRDRAVADAYEPGSTFKLITAAAALESGKVTMKTRFPARDQIDVGGHTIHNAEDGFMAGSSSTESLEDIVAYSHNVGAAEVGMKVGATALYAMIRNFGFGDYTHVELGGENKGIVPPVSDWSGSSVATISFGHGISTTPIALTRAYAAIANGGLLLRPRLVHALEDANGKVLYTYAPEIEHRAISEDTAAKLRGILRAVVVYGTGNPSARAQGYTTAGKTGTAQVVENGRYEPGEYVGSFIGYVPAEAPRYVIFVKIERPRGAYYGGVVAAPIFAALARTVMLHADVMPSAPPRLVPHPSGEKTGAMMRELRPLLDALGAPRIVGTLPQTVTAIAVDSRTAPPGSLFVAVRGEHVDGHRYAKGAVARGAAVLVVEQEVDVDVAQVIVDDTRVAISRLADMYYGQPSQALTVFGVTGTNGKTTTTYLLRGIVEAAGIPCGVIGTLGGVFGDRTWALENTTPLAVELHQTLAEMRHAGARAVAMEVSSHALALGRVDDVCFHAAALTNVTRDHLDFHGTLARYIAAKRRLFDLAPHAVLNVDDPVGRTFSGEFATATTYAIEHVAQLRATNVVLQGDGARFDAGGLSVEIGLPGRFNVANALAAIGLARAAGIGDNAIVRGLAAARAVPGRMERIGAFGIDAIVDYAHTPDALANVLRAARETTRGRLIVVFGCGGDRDAGKRVEMGRIAADAADAVIVTSDNPRGENPAAIAAAVADGIVAEVILDRRTAIRRAINDARAGDTVVVAGKGHETYQIIGEERLPFDDRDEVRSAFSLRSGALRA